MKQPTVRDVRCLPSDICSTEEFIAALPLNKSCLPQSAKHESSSDDSYSVSLYVCVPHTHGTHMKSMVGTAPGCARTLNLDGFRGAGSIGFAKIFEAEQEL